LERQFPLNVGLHLPKHKTSILEVKIKVNKAKLAPRKVFGLAEVRTGYCWYRYQLAPKYFTSSAISRVASFVRFETHEKEACYKLITKPL